MSACLPSRRLRPLSTSSEKTNKKYYAVWHPSLQTPSSLLMYFSVDTVYYMIFAHNTIHSSWGSVKQSGTHNHRQLQGKTQTRIQSFAWVHRGEVLRQPAKQKYVQADPPYSQICKISEIGEVPSTTQFRSLGGPGAINT